VGVRSLARPTLVIVSGPPGSGKTRLAHALAQAIPCPAICRDEIKEGMAHAEGADFEPALSDPLTMRTLKTFFKTLRLLLAAGVTVVAEAAFQDAVWRRGLEPLSELAELRIVHCTVDAAVAWERAAKRPPRTTHAVGEHMRDLQTWKPWFESFERLSIPAPSIVVDTTDGYVPRVDEIVEFVNHSSRGSGDRTGTP
jgi:predicted kinase